MTGIVLMWALAVRLSVGSFESEEVFISKITADPVDDTLSKGWHGVGLSWAGGSRLFIHGAGELPAPSSQRKWAWLTRVIYFFARSGPDHQDSAAGTPPRPWGNGWASLVPNVPVFPLSFVWPFAVGTMLCHWSVPQDNRPSASCVR